MTSSNYHTYYWGTLYKAKYIKNVPAISIAPIHLRTNLGTFSFSRAHIVAIVVPKICGDWIIPFSSNSINDERLLKKFHNHLFKSGLDRNVSVLFGSFLKTLGASIFPGSPSFGISWVFLCNLEDSIFRGSPSDDTSEANRKKLLYLDINRLM